jgi:hypothetical protein
MATSRTRQPQCQGDRSSSHTHPGPPGQQSSPTLASDPDGFRGGMPGRKWRPVIGLAAVPSACHRGHTRARGEGHATAVPTRTDVWHPHTASPCGHEFGAAGHSQATEAGPGVHRLAQSKGTTETRWSECRAWLVRVSRSLAGHRRDHAGTRTRSAATGRERPTSRA